ncbi:MAG: hypothetical protein IT494_02725 [Gammaproteobacteria bacterium]|nr:hypothetical protein [Gammaproteobacteria bacterium]
MLKVPTVALSGSNIVSYAIGYDFKYTNGMPVRYVAVPFPITGQPKAVHKAYVRGPEPLSGKPMMEAIEIALTKPLTAEERVVTTAGDMASIEPRLLPADTEENLQQLFKDREWTDYNPIILPTEERVKRMLTGTSHKADELIRTVTFPGGARDLTVEKVAIHAVMAGAKPKYMPLLLALSTRAPFATSTSSMANTIVVNGPIAKELGMNAGTNAMGPYNEANSVIGRFFTLISKTAGDMRNNVTAWESLGNNLQYNSLTIAENEDLLPEGWQPLHVQMGFKPTDSVVTTGTGWSYISSLGEVQPSYPAHQLIRDYMRALSGSGSGATIFVDPTVAQLLKDVNGFKTKQQLSQWLSENVDKTVASYWGNGVITTSNIAMALQGLEPYATWRKLPGDALIKPFNNPGAIQVVVVGGAVQTTWFATDFRLGRGVLVDDWR